jgi:hypothetical protein
MRSYCDSPELLCSLGLEFGNTVPASNGATLRQRQLAAVKQEDATSYSSTFIECVNCRSAMSDTIVYPI